MATFAKTSFDTTIQYATFRTTYPKQLFNSVFRYHEHTPVRNETQLSIWDVELCVIGVDPSAKKIAGAHEAASHDARATGTAHLDRFEYYVQGNLENLSFLDDGSVDLLISGSYAHETVLIYQK
ncbi:hypothetical protein FIBSPDRAFT_970187 [Athelia psychrophila]|uniref:Methyltransferase type 11 domain-containing protein n=1 Tax=Athelia psychrophila TaxID=1759441 RepID=A0A167SVK7_9AGAM|nr:hypothetical protein FIBSPDRAFT_970187 [Fibularhizoctonia sp. CBS 109695]